MISIIEQCQFLEDGYDTSFVADCLNDPKNAHLISVTDRLETGIRDGKSTSLTETCIGSRIVSSWAKLWDFGLDYGYHGTKSL